MPKLPSRRCQVPVLQPMKIADGRLFYFDSHIRRRRNRYKKIHRYKLNFTRKMHVIGLESYLASVINSAFIGTISASPRSSNERRWSSRSGSLNHWAISSQSSGPAWMYRCKSFSAWVRAEVICLLQSNEYASGAFKEVFLDKLNRHNDITTHRYNDASIHRRNDTPKFLIERHAPSKKWHVRYYAQKADGSTTEFLKVMKWHRIQLGLRAHLAFSAFLGSAFSPFLRRWRGYPIHNQCVRPKIRIFAWALADSFLVWENAHNSS